MSDGLLDSAPRLAEISPRVRMLRKAFARVSDRKQQWTERPSLCRLYAAHCHDMGLLLRNHGLAQTVTVLHTQSSPGDQNQQSDKDRATAAYLLDFHQTVAAGYNGTMAPDVDRWSKRLVSNGMPLLELPAYLVQARLALQAADAFKGYAESVLGIERQDTEGAVAEPEPNGLEPEASP